MASAEVKTSEKMSVVPTKLFIGNLPEGCKRSDLQGLFEKYGKVTECDIVKNYGFVHFEREDDARAAVSALHKTDFQGSQIRVELSTSTVRQKPGMGGEGECFRCGGSGHWSKDCPSGGVRPRLAAVRAPAVGEYEQYYDDYYYRRTYTAAARRYSPYDDPYLRGTYLATAAVRDPYAAYTAHYLRDPYARPPPEYYRRAAAVRDPYTAAATAYAAAAYPTVTDMYAAAAATHYADYGK